MKFLLSIHSIELHCMNTFRLIWISKDHNVVENTTFSFMFINLERNNLKKTTYKVEQLLNL